MAFKKIEEDRLVKGSYYEPKASPTTVMGAGWELGFPDTYLMSQARQEGLKNAAKFGRKMSPEEVKTQYGITTKEAMTEGAAMHIADGNADRARIQSIIDTAPDTFFGKTLPRFVGTAAGVMTDPVDMGIGYVLGLGTVSALNKIRKIKKIGEASMLAARLADASGNAVGLAFTEREVMKATRMEQREYTAQQAFTNVLVGGFGFMGVTFGAGKLFKKLLDRGGEVYSAFEKATDLAGQLGKDTGKVIDNLDMKLVKDVEIDDTFRVGTIDAVGEKRAKEFLESDDLIDSFDKMRKTLDQDEVNNVVKSLKAAGFDERKFQYAGRKVRAELPKEALASFKRTLTDKTTDKGFNKTADKMQNTDVQIKEEVIDKEMIEHSKNIEKTLREDKGMTERIEVEDKLYSKSKDNIGAYEALAKCGRII